MWSRGVSFKLQRFLLSVAAICCLLPTFFLIIKAFSANGHFSLQHFEAVLLYDWRFYVWLGNSVFYTATILLIHIPVSALAAYWFSQYYFRGRKALFFLYVLLMLLPFQSTVVSQYITLNAIGLLNTHWAVILPNAFGAFGVFLLTQFMRNIDRDILQAAHLDGANAGTTLQYIILPMCKPAIAALIVLQAISCWSLIDQPLLFLRSEDLLPLALELGSSVFGKDVFAAGVIFSVPPVLIYLFSREALEEGICLSNLK